MVKKTCLQCRPQALQYGSTLFALVPLTHSVLRLFYWQATGALSLIPSFVLSYLYQSPVSGTILSVRWVYQLTGYRFSPIKWSNTENMQKLDVYMYLNERRHMAALGIQSMFLPTPYGGASIEWVKGNQGSHGLVKYVISYFMLFNKLQQNIIFFLNKSLENSGELYRGFLNLFHLLT